MLIAIPIILGLLAGAGAASEAHVALSPQLLPMVALGVVGFVVLRVIGWFVSPFAGNEELDKLPEQAEVIPVYQYQGAYYEAPITTAQDLRETAASQRVSRLQAMPSHVPVYRARPIYAQLPKAGKVRTAPPAQRGYGEPEYMVDGTLVGYRYFDRDLEGNLSSIGMGNWMGKGDWGGGKATAHQLPTEENRAGLWAAYTPDSPFLDDYNDHDVKAAVGFKGQVVFGEKGFRAEEGEVIQILEEKPHKGKPLKFHKNRTKGRF